SGVTQHGAERVSFISGSDLVSRVAQKLNSAKSPTFLYVYWDVFDNLEHVYNPYTQETDFELDSLSYILTNQLLPNIQPEALENTLLLITADHGQTEIYSDKYVYLSDFPELVNTFEQSPSGKRIMPTGGVRDVFLHIQPDK